MTKFTYASLKDKKLIENSIDYLANLIFGTNNQQQIAMMREILTKRIKEVNIFPQGTTTRYLSSSTPGICRLDESDDKLIVEMLGYVGAPREKHDFIKHEGAHEFCHAFADLLPLICSEHQDGIIKKGIKCQNHMGLIKETDPNTGELVGQHYYGKMYNETIMDIITTMAINTFDNPYGPTVDEILATKYDEWNDTPTGYSIFTSLTRLTIAAFSNNGRVNYQSVINRGAGIFTLTTYMNNGEKYYANDFLYGILFDPLHIEQEFDKFMGAGYYRIFCEYLDRLFITCQRKQKLPSEEIKRIMNILPEFLNKKMAYYKAHNLITTENANIIVGNFNRIWNQMQQEYSAYFTKADIDEIYRKARQGF